MAATRISNGLMRTPSGRVREMTAREIDAHAAEMEAFADRVAVHYGALDGKPPFFRCIGAVCLAEDEESR